MTSPVRTTRLGLALFGMLLAGLVGGLICGIVWAPATQAAAKPPLAHSTVAQIKAVPHPVLRRTCGGPIVVTQKFDRTRVAGHRVIVVGTTCEGSTAASPLEISAYTFRGGKVVRLHYLTYGGSFTRDHGKVWVTATTWRTSGTRVTLVYAGYTETDPMCCPTRIFHRVDGLHGNRLDVGALTRFS